MNGSEFHIPNDMWPLHPQQGPVFNFGPLPLYQNETVIDTITDQTNLTTQITEHSVDFINRNKKQSFLFICPTSTATRTAFCFRQV